MLCPHKLGTDANWLSESERYIRGHEDNDASPDIWAVSYYAAYLEAHAVTPEQTKRLATINGRFSRPGFPVCPGADDGRRFRFMNKISARQPFGCVPSQKEMVAIRRV